MTARGGPEGTGTVALLRCGRSTRARPWRSPGRAALLVGPDRVGAAARGPGQRRPTVLVAQLIMGLVNDLLDVDRRPGVGRREDKPIADGIMPPGNASFAVAVLLLLVIPLVAAERHRRRGLSCSPRWLVGYVHNRWLHRTLLSWVGWAATFALLTWFVTSAAGAARPTGPRRYTWFVVLCAALGVCVHFLTSLPDLVRRQPGRVRHLPLRVALRTGAPAAGDLARRHGRRSLASAGHWQMAGAIAR